MALVNPATRLLNVASITGAGTTTGTNTYELDPNTESVLFYTLFVYGSGGTSVDTYFQTSIDGTNFFDISSHQHLLASANKVSNVIAANTVVPVATTDGTLAANTNNTGLIGRLIRVKYTVVGTYAGGTTLTCYMWAKKSV